MGDYRGKVAVVTGASAGLGRRLALDLSSAGAVVVGVARREERLQALVDEMQKHRARSSYRVCDLSEAASFVGLLDQVEEEYGRIDILANIAGVSGIMRTEPTTEASLRSIMEVNYIAPVAGMMTVLSGMRKRKSGAIANMSSDDGRVLVPVQPPSARARLLSLRRRRACLMRRDRMVCFSTRFTQDGCRLKWD